MTLVSNGGIVTREKRREASDSRIALMGQGDLELFSARYGMSSQDMQSRG